MSDATSTPSNIPERKEAVAPTPQNTPLNAAPIGREGLSRPTVASIGEDDEESEGAGGALAGLSGHPALRGLMQSKLASLIGRSSGYIETLPPAVRQRVTALKGLQRDHNLIEQEFQREILELEKKYAARYEPIYERRRALVAGEQEPSPEELDKGKQVEQEDGEDLAEEASVAEVNDGDDAVEGIPNFWLTALQNNPGISELITERDQDALQYLTDIRLSYLPEDSKDGQPGFRLTFSFAPNEYFSNDKLVKSYYYQDEVGYSGDFVYDRAEGDAIQWKGEEGEKDLTKKIEVKKQRNKNTNRTRVVKKVLPAESFFNFFSPPKPPTEDDDRSESELADLDERLELDYQIGEDLKERVIPRAVDHFTGKSLEYEGLGDDESFDDEDDYDDEDDEDDDEDGPVSRSHPPAGAEGQQECKNQ